MGVSQFSNPQLQVQPAKLLATIAVAQFPTASTNEWFTYPSVLSRNARKRTFFFEVSFNQAVTLVGVSLGDSSVQNFNLEAEGTGPAGVSMLWNVSGSNADLYTFESDSFPVLAGNVDSIEFEFSVGATLPTAGTIKIYVTEVL